MVMRGSPTFEREVSVPPRSPAILRIGIVGGGASGCLVAANLLQQAGRPIEIVLIEKRETIGLGTAYATTLPAHLLNVPAGRMGAWPDDPGHFLRWAQVRAGAPGWGVVPQADDYLPRSLYGEYLADILSEAESSAPAGCRLVRIQGEVIDLDERPDGGAHVVLETGESHPCDRVVLALGNLPGAYPLRKYLTFYRTRRYVHVPWDRIALGELCGDAVVLVVGQGLTAVDVVTALVGQGHKGPIVALSRRGLRPHGHKTGLQPYPSFVNPTDTGIGLRALVRLVRGEVARAAAQGIDWRPVIDSLRPHVSALWQQLSIEDKARFLRHVRPYWEIHRHRLAPSLDRKMDLLVQSGRVRPVSGRIESITEVGAHVRIEVRLRADGAREFIDVDSVVNCTGPRTDYTKYQHPLMVNLLSRGLVDHDPLALGIAATPEGEVLRYGGGRNPWMSTLGPPMRGLLWECTAIPEIRVQAAALAGRILAA